MNIADRAVLKLKHRNLCFLTLYREAGDVIWKPYIHSYVLRERANEINLSKKKYLTIITLAVFCFFNFVTSIY